MSERENMKSSVALQSGCILNGRYKIETVLGEGGFGITYKAICVDAKETVAIKEYFPGGYATRQISNGDQEIHPFAGTKTKEYEEGKHRFLNEAEVLKSFQQLEGIVSVFESFQENNTAYIVMEYVEGITLKQYILENGPLPYEELIDLFQPVVHSLAMIHKKVMIHRDISPDNLMIVLDNRLYLIDFGTARGMNLDEDKTMTVILKSGYAPPEQYLSHGKQGAWTDIYALGATMYYALTGATPVESVGRLQGKELESLKERTDLKNWQADAIEKAMSIQVVSRYAAISDFFYALRYEPSVEEEKTVHRSEPSKVETALIEKSISNEEKDKVSLIKKLVSVMVLLVLIYSGLAWAGWLDLPWPDAFSMRSSTKENTTEQEMKITTRAVNLTEENLELCVMPDVVNQPIEQAKQIIQQIDASISIQIEEKEDEKVKKGTVIAQSILGDTQFNKGKLSKMTLTVSAGKTTKAESTTSKAASTTQSTTKEEKKSKYNNFDNEDDELSSFRFGE